MQPVGVPALKPVVKGSQMTNHLNAVRQEIADDSGVVNLLTSLRKNIQKCAHLESHHKENYVGMISECQPTNRIFSFHDLGLKTVGTELYTCELQVSSFAFFGCANSKQAAKH